MQLEFVRGLIPDQLYTELDFASFLELFIPTTLPMLPGRILKPMSKAEGTTHFAALRDIESYFSPQNITYILRLSKEMSCLEALLTNIELGTLEQYHLFDLGHFLTAELTILQAEKNFPITGAPHGIFAMHSVLTNAMGPDFATISGDSRTKQLQKEITSTEALLQKQLSGHEQTIYDETGLKMIYPLPREVDLKEDALEQLQTCSVLQAVKKGRRWLIEHKPDNQTLDSVQKRDLLMLELESLLRDRLTTINESLQAHFPAFFAHYRRRQQRVWLYHLLSIKNSHGFSFPLFDKTLTCNIRQAVNPFLKKQKQDDCIPLDIALDRGANVLFGPNMSGKTTVLKTIYFLLTLVRTGLPLPVESIVLAYPEQVSLFLRSSGTLQDNLSSFGAELDFLSGKTMKGSYVLVDELLLSTDPVNGAQLSKIFLQNYAQKELVFLCTSHYPAVLDLKEISLFRMLDCELPSMDGAPNLEKLKSNMPYRLEKLDKDSDRAILTNSIRPLEIALFFPLAEEIKEEIRSTLLNKKVPPPEKRNTNG